MTIRWDRAFLIQALNWAMQSKDPNTRVGAVIIGPDLETRATGFNGFARGIIDHPDRLSDRDTKNRLMVHAECNAIYNAARIGTSLKGCTLYLLATDDTGAVWGGSPCAERCVPAVIQAGIVEVVSIPFKSGFSKWRESVEAGRTLLAEAGVFYREVPSLVKELHQMAIWRWSDA